jgi:transcriptional regulator of acetoin/glycerol metabolism
LTDEAAAALQRHPWPGNVRELRNVLERAALLCPGGAIGPADLRFGDARHAAEPDAPPPGGLVSLAENERRYLEQVLRGAGGRVEEAARALGIPRSSMYEKLKRHGLSGHKG